LADGIWLHEQRAAGAEPASLGHRYGKRRRAGPGHGGQQNRQAEIMRLAESLRADESVGHGHFGRAPVDTVYMAGFEGQRSAKDVRLASIGLLLGAASNFLFKKIIILANIHPVQKSKISTLFRREVYLNMAKLEVFVACPHQPRSADDYKAVLNTVINSFKNDDIDFKLADEPITGQPALDKIISDIKTADISLFDITGWDPSVFTELGIAIGLAKRHVLLLNKTAETNHDTPFDLQGMDKLQYSSCSELEIKLLLLIKQQLPQEPSDIDTVFETLKNRIRTVLAQNPNLKLMEISEKVGQEKALVQSTLRAMAAAG